MFSAPAAIVREGSWTWAMLSQVTLRISPSALSALQSPPFAPQCIDGLHQSLVQKLSGKEWTTRTPNGGSAATTRPNAAFRRDLKLWNNQQGVDLVASCHREFTSHSNQNAVKKLYNAVHQMIRTWWSTNSYHVRSIECPKIFLSIQTSDERENYFSAYHWGISFETKLGYNTALENPDMEYFFKIWLQNKCRYIHLYETKTRDQVFVDAYLIYHKSITISSMRNAIKQNVCSIIANCKVETIEFWEDVGFISDRRQATAASTILDATLIDIIDLEEVGAICAREAQQRNLNTVILQTPAFRKRGARQSNLSESVTDPTPGKNYSLSIILYYTHTYIYIYRNGYTPTYLSRLE